MKRHELNLKKFDLGSLIVLPPSLPWANVQFTMHLFLFPSFLPIFFSSSFSALLDSFYSFVFSLFVLLIPFFLVFFKPWDGKKYPFILSSVIYTYFPPHTSSWYRMIFSILILSCFSFPLCLYSCRTILPFSAWLMNL